MDRKVLTMSTGSVIRDIVNRKAGCRISVIRALRKENKLKIRARKMMLAHVGKDAHKKPGYFKVGLILVCVVVACVCL
jgi:hypothetical protein